jgi:ATP-dependent RNA helicase RhlB
MGEVRETRCGEFPGDEVQMIRKFIGKVLGKKQAEKKIDKKVEKTAGSREKSAPRPPAPAPRKTEKEGAKAPRTGKGTVKEDRSRGSSDKARVAPSGGSSRGAGKPRESRRESPPQKRPPRSAPAVFPELPPMPEWTPPEDPSRFANYGLPRQVMEGIEAAGFETCTEVQAKVLPLALGGRDIAAQSQTGTGKTAAFLITTFSRLLWRGPVDHPGPRALVLAPTRELAVQIQNDALLLGGALDMKVGVAFGGVDYERQRRILEEGVDLLIGTPGRLIDYMKQGVWKPEGIEMLIIDEADRMLDMGFIKDLRFILRRLPSYERRLSMLFSATLSWRAMELTYEYMNLPEQISASSEKVTAERAEEVLYHVGRTEKAGLLLGLLKKDTWKRTMIFTNMKVEAEKVGSLLAHHGFKAEAITGNLEQKKRLRLMEDFKSGQLPIMVATDVASRGLHVEGVTHVVNWDLPQDPEDYVHRIGRTARAGKSGMAVAFADEECVYYLEAIEGLIGYKVPVRWHTSKDLEEVKKGWRPPRPERKAGPGRKGGPPGKRGGGGGGRQGSSRRPPRRS